jgi:hypothetical protein
MKHLTSLIALTLFALLTSCEPTPEDLFTRHFLIRKGEHYSTPRLTEVLQSERLIFTAKFDNTAIYNLGDAALQTNINKLLGFADCNSVHHDNSARFGWQWDGEKMKIFAYCYVDGDRIEQYIGTVNLNEVNRYELELTGSHYVFYLNGEMRAEVKRSDNLCNTGIYYLLYPYFGGGVPSPHDINIDLTILR